MKNKKKFKSVLLTPAILFGLCTFNSVAFSAAGDGGSGGSGGSGSGEILGDLVVLDRYPSGVPILTTDGCQQPLAADGTKIPVDPATCAVVAGGETLLQAVDFSRMSVARSPASVMDKQMADVLVNLSTAQCITLDPAGRLVYSNPDTADVDGDANVTELLSSAVDSPLQNLAIYRELITKGALGTPAITLPKPFDGYSMLDTAAKALGAASDKGGKIDIDLVVYLNQILGLDLSTTPTQLPKICIDIKQEVKGVVQTVNKCFLDYSIYNYERSQTHGNLPFPKNIPATNPQLGYFEYLTPDITKQTADGRPFFYINSGPIVPTVFVSLPSSLANIGGFAQASDDARAVIEFMHSHPVMAAYARPVLCEGSAPPPPAVDVSSKLQMPTRMTGNTTREGTLTVSNLKGAQAIGDVTLIGNYSGGSVSITPSSPYSFSLAAGQSKAFAVSFKAPRTATTITWTAKATAAGDSNSTNDTATFTTTVTAARGQGGGD